MSDIDLLKKAAGDAATGYTDDQLQAMLDANDGSVDATAAELWSAYASSKATLVDVSEGSSSRKLSQFQSQALKMAEYYRLRAAAEDVGGTAASHTYPILRAGS